MAGGVEGGDVLVVLNEEVRGSEDSQQRLFVLLDDVGWCVRVGDVAGAAVEDYARLDMA